MYQGKKIKLTERQKKIFYTLMGHEEIQFFFYAYEGTKMLFMVHPKNNSDGSLKFQGIDSFLKTISISGDAISTDEVKGISRLFKGDNAVVFHEIILNDEEEEVSIKFIVDSSITNGLKEGAQAIDKKILLERFKQMIDPLNLEINPKEIIQNNKIKFFIKKDDDCLKNGESYVVQIAHEVKVKENEVEKLVTKLWSTVSTHKNEGDYQEYEVNLKELSKIFKSESFNVVDYILGMYEMNILKDSPLSQGLKEKINKNEFVKINDAEYIDVTDEVAEIIKHEFENQPELTDEKKADLEKHNKETIKRAVNSGKELLEKSINQRTQSEVNDLKFNLNFIQKIIGIIVDFLLKLICVREQEIGKYDETKITKISDLENLKNESKTWANQMKFDECVEKFIEKNKGKLKDFS